MAALWYMVYCKYNKRLPLTVTSQIKYYRPGGKEGVLECDPGSH